MNRVDKITGIPTSNRVVGLLARRRFQLIGALLLGGLLPFVLRGMFLPGTPFEPAPANALAANCIAILIAFWTRLSIETYPGIRSSYVILPAALTAHAIVVAVFLLTRLPYDRLGLALGFVLHVLWNYFIYFRVDRRIRRRIAVVPFGAVGSLREIVEVDWQMLRSPSIKETRGAHAIVADFSADLPDEWEAFLAEAALRGRIVYQVKQLSESLTGRVELGHLSENSFGSLLPARGYFYLKSVGDWLLAVLILPFTLPIMGVAALAIMIEDGSPALFRQERLGHRGRIFTAFKFRTMRVEAVPQDEGAARESLATSEVDTRITRVGAVLRKYRIDEIPQILNILRGEMSWIGPRPEPELLSRWFLSEIPFYPYRHVVKPGISGWAQVNQGYVSGVEGINQKLNYDFYYIKYFSPWLDLLILFKTLRTMLTGFGAR